tara:strand:+ start:14043 stop:14768 length:726 start_codon:yes stop_codon:yes gene_type:complete
MIKNAVILAAGLGSRIESFSKDKPKGFIEINNISLIERSLEILINEGISSVYIGTGYKSFFYENLKKKYKSIVTLKNLEYKSTGSFHTLYQFKSILNEDFILLESDLIYERSAISKLISDLRKNIILSSNFSKSGDEVYVIESSDILMKLTKNPKKNELPSSEFIGINKISNNLFREMCFIYEKINRKDIEYEELLNKCAISTKIYIKNLKEIAWCEIDNLEHLRRAIEIINPKIIKNEKI